MKKNELTTKNTKGTKNKAYPNYKPSGVEWLGDVPEHWGVKRAGLAYSIQLGKMLQPDSSEAEDDQYEYLKALHVQWETIQTNDLPVMWASNYEVSKYSIKRGDLLVCEGGEVGRCGILKEDLENVIIQNSLHRVRSKNNLNLFLMFVLENAASKNWFDILCNKATIAHFTGDKFSALRIPLPPPHEQQAIAAFLDRETGRIDTLIDKKQRLLELLAEQRTALISATVTGKIDITTEDTEGTEKGNKQFREFRAFRGYPKYKPSGVEWLGDIPKHWVVTELRRFVRFITSGSRGWAEHYSDAGKIFVRIGNLTRHSIDIDLSDIQYVDPPEGAEGERTKIASGDILFSITAYIGSVAVATEEIAGAYINQHIALVRPLIDKIYPRFVAYAGFSDYGQAQLSGQGYGGTKVQLALDDVKSLRIALPPLPEQQAIADFLDREMAKIDTLSAKVVTVIERLKEYRTALISSAVTGKINVSTCAESAQVQGACNDK